MDWWECSIVVGPAAVDGVSELFARYGYNGAVAVAVDAPGPPSEPPTYIVRTYLLDDAGAEEARRQLTAGLQALGAVFALGPLRATRISADAWAAAWQRHYPVHRVGRRLTIKPSWHEYHPGPDELILDLDPGVVFGTGLHPTTRLCLRALEDTITPDLAYVLDLGTGSAILAIAAARLGGPALQVWALDADPEAARVAAANVARNALEERITVSDLPLDVFMLITPPYDLVVANILPGPIIALAPTLYAALIPGGVLIASGIQVAREGAVTTALRAAGFQPRERREESGWLALIVTRPAAGNGPIAMHG